MKILAVTLCIASILLTKEASGQMTVTLDYSPSQYTDNSLTGGEFRALAGGTPSLFTAIDTAAYSSATSGSILGQYYFQTFCIETNENFTPLATYNVSISLNAMNGGQPPLGDPVSIGTAWLYSQFAAGTLAGYNYTYGSGRVTSAGQLQTTIWWLENEPVGAVDPGIGNPFRNAVLAQYGNSAAAMSDANGAFGVMALNLGAPGIVQDQLVIVPLIPEPTTAALILTGAMLLLANQRRRSS